MKCFYSPGYYLPLPEGHPFPISKYGDSYRYLLQSDERSRFHFEKVIPADLKDILRVHTQEYLDAVQYGKLSKYARNRLGLPVHPRALERNLLDVAGTLNAAEVALEEGIAWNLGGGTHHAMPDEGLGFCVTNDVSVAVLKIRENLPYLSILVLDTDAHQGNGNHRVLKECPGVFTYSIHVGANYPAVKVPGDMDVELPRYVSGDDYLLAFSQSLKELRKAFHPDLIFWVSGVDVHEQDRFGQMKLSTEHIVERNRMVFDYAFQCEAAFVGTYGGGYHRVEGMTATLHAEAVIQSLELVASDS